MRALLAALLLCAAGAEARRAHKLPRDPRTEGLGRNCQKSSECKSRSQRCIKESDANGKAVPQGFCVLPCASFEAGTSKFVPGENVEILKKKKAPPRCPPTYQCRSAGSGVPLDMCVKE